MDKLDNYINVHPHDLLLVDCQGCIVAIKIIEVNQVHVMSNMCQCTFQVELLEGLPETNTQRVRAEFKFEHLYKLEPKPEKPINKQLRTLRIGFMETETHFDRALIVFN